MLNYNQCYDIVEKRLTALAFERPPLELYQPVRYILSIGGKRLRPCLAIMSHSLFSDNIEPVIDPSLGIEIFHNFTLLHDDIMDNAPMRRNAETVHIKWNENTAILSGDAMLILAYQLISNTKPEVLKKVLHLFNQTALEVCEGQQLDMNFEKITDVSVENYLEMIRLKTAVLIAASLATGAITANASAKDIDNLYQFGLNIGIAFQLQDDYLDIFANNDRFGKTIGGDITANKKTYLILSALQHNDPALVNQLRYWIHKEEAYPDKKIAAVKSIYEKMYLPSKTKKMAYRYFKKGLSFLTKINSNSSSKEPLSQFVTQLMEREH